MSKPIEFCRLLKRYKIDTKALAKWLEIEHKEFRSWMRGKVKPHIKYVIAMAGLFEMPTFDLWQMFKEKPKIATKNRAKTHDKKAVE